ncbi:hypothetical protein ACH5RR_029171 [Cinchona calisaya]|uniref:Uncharacterized protein n=1 Tax=Cinchona calisaya TaxID=153742 RepID=A0ABD2YUT4_9GENT
MVDKLADILKRFALSAKKMEDPNLEFKDVQRNEEELKSSLIGMIVGDKPIKPLGLRKYANHISEDSSTENSNDREIERKRKVTTKLLEGCCSEGYCPQMINNCSGMELSSDQTLQSPTGHDNGTISSRKISISVATLLSEKEGKVGYRITAQNNPGEVVVDWALVERRKGIKELEEDEAIKLALIKGKGEG